MKTTYMTHFRSAADCILEIRKASGGLQTHLFEGAKVLAKEHGLDKFESEFKKAMIDLETEYSKHLDEGETLTSVYPAFKTRKSEILRSIKAGLDPNKFDSASKFKNASVKNDNNTGNGGSYTPHDSTGGVDGGTTSTSKVAKVTSNMPSKVRERLNLFIKHLESAPESIALDVLNGADGALASKIRKAGGQLSRVGKAATS